MYIRWVLSLRGWKMFWKITACNGELLADEGEGVAKGGMSRQGREIVTGEGLSAMSESGAYGGVWAIESALVSQFPSLLPSVV